eukprot:TRINITY_DN26759_c0_g1_i1.p1 TRINITY_DN26759_c0_g1~~TRINITY_DN26759_c0_g1_i1.p1  ORF type:complete len:228 (+),score=58.00 TRINITY_DN26759_c0_g1_i1:98-781(+)
MWKKQVNIEGVSSASIVDLKATVYSAQQEAKRYKAAGEKRPKVQLGAKTHELFHSNKGIQERLKRDEAAHAEDEGKHSWETIQVKLLAKSELYNRMARGEVAVDPNDERYTVDFDRHLTACHAVVKLALGEQLDLDGFPRVLALVLGVCRLVALEPFLDALVAVEQLVGLGTELDLGALLAGCLVALRLLLRRVDRRLEVDDRRRRNTFNINLFLPHFRNGNRIKAF